MCGACGKSRKATEEVKSRRRSAQTGGGYDMDGIEGIITGQTTNSVSNQTNYSNRYTEYLRALRGYNGQ